MKSKCDLKASGYCLETCHEKCQRSVGERQEKGERLQDLGRMNLFTFFFFFGKLKMNERVDKKYPLKK